MTDQPHPAAPKAPDAIGVLPAAIVDDCLSASEVDQEVLADDARIVRATWGVSARLVRLGHTGDEDKQPEDLDVAQLSARQARTSLVIDMKVLADRLASHEAAAFRSADELLTEVRADRAERTAKDRGQAIAGLHRAEEELAQSREKLADLHNRAIAHRAIVCVSSRWELFIG